MPRRRDELVDAGVQIALEQRLQDWLASVDTRTITDSVGVTTGSFFHHFRNRAEYTDAVVERFRDLWSERVQHLLDHTQHFASDQGARTLREAAQREWAQLVTPSETMCLQHLLWLARDRAVSDDSSVTAGDVLRAAYRELGERVQPVYDDSLASLGREMLPPFSPWDLTVLTLAVAEGLQMRATVDPESVREDLYADGVGALFIAMTRPRAERVDDLPPEELATRTARAMPRRLREAEEAPQETWRQIAEAAAHLFVDRSPTEVRVADVADAAGVSTSTVYHQFGSVSAVAAAAFVRYWPDLRDVSAQPITAAEGPLVRIEQVMVRYVQLLLEQRGMAEALVTETARARGPAPSSRGQPIRSILPFTDLVADHIRELRVRGLLRRRIETERLARSLFQLATIQAMSYPDDPVERVVDEVLTLVFDGALAVASGP